MNTLHLHNTYSGKKEPFTPQDPNNVTMYVCGPTVYNFIHIGNARPATVFDVLFRLLKHDYVNVTYARNITDVDDKINNAAAEAGVPISEITEKYADEYHQDLSELCMLAPTLEPRATHNIDAMITLVEDLVRRGHAYEAESHVLFDVSSMDDYGKLSNRDVEDMQAGARVEVADYKRNAADFVLWKPSTDDLPGWDSPWGRGRPGWHLECSAMIRKHLGKTIDIHGGGQDLIFPHHENEIAQSVCCEDDAQFVRYWLHNGYITVASKEEQSGEAKEEKMSKSLGNFKTVRGLLEDWDGEVIRYALLSSHYRSPLAWSEDLLQQAKNSLERLYQALRQNEGLISSQHHSSSDISIDVKHALYDDLNTPGALSALHGLAKEINKIDDDLKKAALVNQLKTSAGLLGLLERDPESFFKSGSDDNSVSAEKIEALIAQRNKARADKDWGEADRIRDEITALGVELEDGTGGTQWKFT